MNAANKNGLGAKAPQALAGVTVLEIASAPGACFAASLLADFNATVYVCETLPNGSAMRALEPCEWWAIAARNKKSVAVDPKVAGAEDAIKALSVRKASFDTVILSPGAPSYGQLERPGVVFKNFEERGAAFVRLAEQYFGAAG